MTPVFPKLAIGAVALALACGSMRARAQDASPVAGPPLGVTGTVRFHGDVPSKYVARRNVEVWLPPGYERGGAARYPVLYMHDGQNVFAPSTSYTKVDWGVDETMSTLIAQGKVRPAIVVAVWNTPARFAEYMPRKALASEKDIPAGVVGVPPLQGPILSDDYLHFLVEELKPFIDRTYRTRTGPEDTFIMGSSMGGLISAYGVTEYPSVFGGAACLSTHWPAGNGATIAYLKNALPRATSSPRHRFWFDHGTATLDSLYAPYQKQADEVMRGAGYTQGKDWVTRVYPGADHSERSWRVRLADPLMFLLRP